MADRTPADHTAQKPDITSSIEHEPEPECSSSPIASSFVPEATARPAEKKQAIYYNDGLAARYLTSVDRSLLRLRRLISSTAGLDVFLGTVNSALDVVAFLNTPGRLQEAYQRVGFNVGLKHSPAFLQASQLAISSKTLSGLLAEARTTLRLTALLPLYATLRQLLKSEQRRDPYLRAILLTQCMSYIIYQAAENVAFLCDRRVLSSSWIAKQGGTAKLWLLSNRAWLIGVLCDFVALFRRAIIQKRRKIGASQYLGEVKAQSEGEGADKGKDEIQSVENFNKQWWRSIFVASCNLPMCVHYSLQKGLWGANGGALGLLGFMAGAQTFTDQWAEISCQ